MKTSIVTRGVFLILLFACSLGAQTDAEPVPTLPDLCVKAVSTSPRQPCAGETTQIIVWLGNCVGVAVGEFEATITIGNEEPMVVPIPGLGANQSTTVVIESEFTVEQGVHVTVTMDPRGRVKEHDETNNAVVLKAEANDC